LPEVPVYASVPTSNEEVATAGIADAVVLGPDGAAQTVVDWKTDVAPTPETLEHYRAQVHAYLDMTRAGGVMGLAIDARIGAITVLLALRSIGASGWGGAR
jgi:exodeoxyribonuclease-5